MIDCEPLPRRIANRVLVLRVEGVHIPIYLAIYQPIYTYERVYVYMRTDASDIKSLGLP